MENFLGNLGKSDDFQKIGSEEKFEICGKSRVCAKLLKNWKFCRKSPKNRKENQVINRLSTADGKICFHKTFAL